MSDHIRLEVNTQELADRFRRTLPNLTKEEIIRAMQLIVGKLEARVIQEIHQDFLHQSMTVHPNHISLEDAVLGTVRVEGDIVIGSVGVDTEAVPYARILEEGGVIPPHIIRPRHAGALAIDAETLKNPVFMSRTRGEEITELTLTYVKHPGAQIAAYHFLMDSLNAMEALIGGDLTEGWQRAMMRSGF